MSVPMHISCMYVHKCTQAHASARKRRQARASARSVYITVVIRDYRYNFIEDTLCIDTAVTPSQHD